MDYKNDIIVMLRQISRVMREVKQLDSETVRLLAVNAGLSVSEIEELEGKCDLAEQFIVNDLMEADEVKLQIDNENHFSEVDSYLEQMDELTERERIIIIKSVMRSDEFDNDLERFNELLDEVDRPFRVVTVQEEQRIREFDNNVELD